MLSSFRQILQYDSLLGHKYVPNITARLQHGNRGYLLSTDKYGFRNSPLSKNKTGLKIIALGDSYTAGEGISNAERFTDILQKRYNCTIHNLAVSDYGIDQQVLAYEKYAKYFDHDMVIIFPFLDDLDRTLYTERVGLDKNTGQKVLIPKPYFQMEDHNLVLRNNPVPKIKNPVVSSVENTWAKKRIRQFKDFVKTNAPFVFPVASFLQRTFGVYSFPWTTDERSKQWAVSIPIFKKLKKLTQGKQIIIAPIPYHKSVVLKESSNSYLKIFNKLVDERTSIIDFMDVLIKNNSYNQESVYLNVCGHFSKSGHEVIGEELAKFLIRKNDLQVSDNKQQEEDSSNYILGISCFYHDSACCLLENGNLIAAAQEERFSRIKNDSSFPIHSLNYCLGEAQIEIDSVSAIVYYDYETWTLERALWNINEYSNGSQPNWKKIPNSLYQKTMLAEIIRSLTNYQGETFKCPHHVSHAAGAFYTSGFEEAAIVVIDGVGEWACTTIADGTNTKIRLINQQYYPHSIGLLYSSFTYYLGFKVNSGEYKVMGLAAYGKPIYVDLIKDKIVEINDDGSIQLNLDYFTFQFGKEMINKNFDNLFGRKRRTPESEYDPFYLDIAASIQKVTEEIIIKIANYAKKITGRKNLVFSGGVALNSVANGQLLDHTDYERFYFDPAAGDSGACIGAAIAYHHQNSTPEIDELSKSKHSMYLGPSFSSEEIFAYLNSQKCNFHKFRQGERGHKVADFIFQNKVVGYFDGRMEFGPRALGSRSILANALNPNMKEILNSKIKFREDFRPFAPLYLEKRTSDYFEYDLPSPFMNIVRKVKKGISQVPSITHVDRTARLQSLNSKQNPRLYSILEQFEKISGEGIMINTSFNVRGEPIVCTPYDAYQCFLKTGMDILVLGDYYLMKNDDHDVLSQC